MGLSPAPEPVMSQAAPVAAPAGPPPGVTQDQRAIGAPQAGSGGAPTPPSAGQQAGLQQRAKRTKLPPPSKVRHYQLE